MIDTTIFWLFFSFILASAIKQIESLECVYEIDAGFFRDIKEIFCPDYSLIY